ncbi:MAG: GTP-binding protein [Candidatus Lokiarchaeota archaeon]
MDILEKIPLSIGMFGHIDSGKTAVAEVLSEIISTAGIDAHPQSKERGITIDLGFTSFILKDYLVTLVDGPGHADLIKISASSVEIIDLGIIVIDITKGPQIQTGEHLIMVESLGIKNILILLNKTDLFKGDLEKKVKSIRNFFQTTSFGSNVPIFPVSAKEKTGFVELKQGLLKIIKSLNIQRDYESDVIIPIDHHFTVKGIGTVITGTLIQGTLRNNQIIQILPLNLTGKIKNIQIFHQNTELAKAGNRVGINIRNIDADKIDRGFYATDNADAFGFCEILDIEVKESEFFKPRTQFGTQVHITIGMKTVVGNIYPYYEIQNKKVQTSIKNEEKKYKAILWLKEKVLMRKENSIILISRLDLSPTTLRILGSAKILEILKNPPLLYKYKIKKGKILYPNHSQGIVCEGLAQSIFGAKKIVGRDLELPFTKIKDTFGTKGSVIIGISDEKLQIDKNTPVFLKELRSFRLKKV